MELERFCWGWRFAEGIEEDDPLHVRNGAKPVDLPHSCVKLPYNYFDEKSYRKKFSYWKDFDYDGERGDIALLRFEAFMAQADIYLNGERLGHYVSLYFPVEIDVTSYLKKGRNLLYLALDAEEDPDIPPFGGAIDYLTYAGIYRPVHLDVKPPVYIKKLLIHADSTGQIVINPEINVVGGTFHFEIHDDKGLVLSSDQRIMKLEHPRLWGIDDPFLYSLRATYTKDGVADSLRVPFGIRDAVWKKDGFYLNGIKTKLLGLNRHQSFPYVGYAVSPSLDRNDAFVLKNELGVNVVRTSHYMDSDSFIEACDELGLLVIDEVPGWQHIGTSKAWRNNYYDFIERLVLNGYNHPSIIAHGVRIDESIDDHDLYEKGNAIAKNIDPYKATIGVRNIRRSELLEDIYGYNDFYGEGPFLPIAPPTLVGNPNHPHIVTEHNGHMNPTKASDSFAQLISQAKEHARKIDGAYKDRRVAGVVGWCFADYNTHSTFGSGDMVCPHGVYDMFRNPKPAAYVYAAQQDEFPVFELLTDFKPGEFKEATLHEIPIATNCDYFDLYRNGRLVGRFRPKRKKRGMPHPIYHLTDIIGESLSDPRFTGRDRKCLSKAFSRAAIAGYKHLGFVNGLRALYLIVKYRLNYEDLLELYNREVASWGGDGNSNSYSFIAYKNGKEAVRRDFGASTSFDLELSDEHIVLRDGLTYDMAGLGVKLIDEHGTKMNFPLEVLDVEVEGPIELISPSHVPLLGGSTRIYVRSLGNSGEGKIRLRFGAIGKEIPVVVK